MNHKGAPLVAIKCYTYNHESYIRQCLDGFVMQKTDFSFTAIVHDDASSDNTASIIREYAEKYPHIIKPIYENENQYSKHDGSIDRRMNEALPESVRYIAICEGDDYWIDPLKLQKQIDYLETHVDVVYSCHRYYVKNEYSNTTTLASNRVFDKYPDKTEFVFSQEYPFRKEWVTKTLTCVYKKDALDNNVLNQFKYYRDLHLVFYVLNKGKGVCHSFIGGVYRKSHVGVYGSLTSVKQFEIDYKVYLEFYEKTHEQIIRKQLMRVIAGCFLKHGKLLSKNFIAIEAILFYSPYFIIKKISRKLGVLKNNVVAL